MKEYIILQHLTASQLEDKVIDKLKLGYMPVGGISFSKSTNSNGLYVQSMILKS